MPVIVREDETTAIAQDGCEVTRLLTADVIGNDQIELDHVAVSGGSTLSVALDANMIGWLQVLEGAGSLDDNALDTKHITYLPFGFTGAFRAGDADTRILFARVPDAARFDENIADMPGELVHVDWTREPVLQSEHDARKRIYMATPGLANTKAFKGEMISYPPGTAAPEHHHVGAEHFQYVVAGEGTAMLDGTAHRLCAGDVL